MSARSFTLFALRLAAWAMCGLLAAAASTASTAAWGQAVCPPPLPVQAGTAPERDRGLLWRITRDGRSSFLFGTLHVGKPAWTRFGPQLSAALRSTDVLALEIDPTDPKLADALQKRLNEAYARACVAPESLATLHPVLQATMLMVLDARWLGMDPSLAMEQLLAAQVRGSGRRVVSLETVAQQKAVLVPADRGDALAMLDSSLTQLEDNTSRRVLDRLSQAWEKGDLATLEDHASWCGCTQSKEDKAYMRRLNDERNPALADGIEAQHQTGKRVFAAVGALHMTGPQALPRLLAQRGFKVERVRSRR